jgi:hypothetical protein
VATAEHNVSSRHNNAIRLENDRIDDYRKGILLKVTTETEADATTFKNHGNSTGRIMAA